MTAISTQTRVTQGGGLLSIYTWYSACVNFLGFFINGTPRSVEGVTFKEGYLGYTVNGIKDTFYLDSYGNLIVSAVNPNKYEIDSEGNLTTTEDFCGNLIP